MNLFAFLTKEMRKSPVPLLVMATLGGLINAILLSAFSNISSAGKDGPDLHAILLILTTMALYYYTKKYTLLTSMTTMEEMINSIRKRVITKLRRADLVAFEQVERANIYSLLTQEVSTLSQSVNALVNAFQSSVIVFFCMIYVGLNSLPALFIMLVAFVLGAVTYMTIRKDTDALLHRLMREDAAFFRTLGHILNGFKEIKLHARKNKAVFRTYSSVVRRLKLLNLQAGKLFSGHMVYTQTYFYLLIGVIVFILPGYADLQKETAMSVTIATLFMVAPLLMCLSAFPELSRANMAISNLYRMETELEGMMREKNANQVQIDYSTFEKIEFQNLLFRFPQTPYEEKPFQIGEIDLSLYRGETLFIVGGNGSGKTTLLKVLTGLYKRSAGKILVDGRLIGTNRISSYRQLFSGVFADYHLFDRLYGIDAIDDEQVNALIDQMELSEKTSCIDGRFSAVKLSQGQRKRLGLIVTLLEDKPIFIFDEWAADQDPHFKDYFYKTLLPQLKAQGKTLIIISHDDRYFDCADRVVKMDFGKIVQ
ncbi:cyclic peptide export ABC transporter [Terasakiella sp.]|uniref:cyclic peptide export ABC transporter n=1 Tax=Terasakiella sp. TaxID=2034861 RepID=UPI003AA7AE83